jgi:hypothetical protein
VKSFKTLKGGTQQPVDHLAKSGGGGQPAARKLVPPLAVGQSRATRDNSQSTSYNLQQRPKKEAH